MIKKQTAKRKTTKTKDKTKVAGKQQTLAQVPDISVEYWGTYEVPALEDLSDGEFRDFVVTAYGGRASTAGEYIHGFKREMPLFVGSSKYKSHCLKGRCAILFTNFHYFAFTFTLKEKEILQNKIL